TGDPGAVEEKQVFTAQTMSRCTVAIMTRTRVASALAGLSGTQLAGVLRGTRYEWRELCCRALRLLTMNVRRRLAYVISELAATFGSPDPRGTLIALRLSH